MASVILKVLKTAIGLSENLIKTLGPGIATALKPLAIIGDTMTASTKAVRIFGKALKKALDVTPLGKVLKSAAPVFKGLKKMALNFGKTLKSIGKIDVLSPFTSLFPIIGRSRAAFELLKGTVLKFKTATLDAFSQIESGTRRAVTSVVSQVDLVNTATGEVITDTAQKIQELDPEFRRIQENLIARAPELVGVTTKDVLDVFEQVSLNFGRLTQQLSAAKAEELGLSQLIGGDGVVDDFAVAQTLTERLASSLKNAGLTARDTAQEVRAILTGDIDFNARLAKRLNLSRAEVELAKARGDLAGLLLERTAAIEDANNVYNKSLENTLSVIKDVGEGFGRIFGKDVFEELQEGLLGFRKRLEDNREILDNLADRLGDTFAPTIDRIIDQINDLFDLFLENETEVADFLDRIVGTLGTAVQFASTVIKTLAQFGVLLAGAGDEARKAANELARLNPAVWNRGGQTEFQKFQDAIEDIDFAGPIDGVTNFKKSIQDKNPISRLLANTGDEIRFLGKLFGTAGQEIEDALGSSAQQQIDNLSSQIDQASNRVEAFQVEIRRAGGDKEKIRELTAEFLKLSELDESNITATTEAIGDIQNDLKDIFSDLTDEQIDQTKLEQRRVILLNLQKAIILSKIPVLNDIKTLQGENVQELIKEKLALLATTKDAKKRKQIAIEIIELQELFTLKVTEGEKKLKAVNKLYDKNRKTSELAAESAETAIEALTTTGVTSAEVFQSLKNAIEKLNFADIVGGDAKNVRDIFDSLGDTFERLDIDDRIKALPLLKKFEAELAKVKDEEVKVEEKLIDLREARGQISTEEAKRQRASVDSNKKLLELLKTQNQLAITRAALGSKTFNRERELIEQLAKAEPKERKGILLKLQQLRITDKIGGTEVAILDNKRRQQTIDLLLQDTRNEALDSELKILEAIKEQNIAKGDKQLAEAEFDFKVNTGGAFLEPIRRAKELQMMIQQNSNLLEKTSAARLQAEEKVAKIISGELEVDDKEWMAALERRNEFIKEEFKLKGEIDAAFIEQATKQAELDMLALERDQQVEQLTLQTNKLLLDGARTLEQSLINTEMGLANISKQEIDIKIDAANALAKFKNEIQSGELEIIDSAAVKSALRDIESEAAGLVKKVGDKFVVNEKKVADLVKKKGELELKLLKAKNKSEQNSIKFRIKEIELAKKLAEIENKKLLQEQKIEMARIKAARDNARKRLKDGELTTDEFIEQMQALQDQADFSNLIVDGINAQTKAQEDFNKELKKSLEAELALAEANGESEEKIQGLKNAIAAVEANTRKAADASQDNADNNASAADEACEEAECKKESKVASFAMSKQKRTGPTFRQNIIDGETLEQYKKAVSELGESVAAGIKMEAQRFSNQQFRAVVGFNSKGVSSITMNQLMEAGNKVQKEGFNAVIRAAEKKRKQDEMAEAQRDAQEQAIRDAESQRENLAREAERRQKEIANARDSLLKRLVNEARQARLAELQLDKDQLQEQINTKESIEEGFADLTKTSKAQIFQNASIVAKQFGGDADEAAEDAQIFAALVDTFGEKTANALRGIVDIDEKILQQLKDGTVKSDDLIKENKIFLDPETGELIVTGADPDFEKLQQLIELQAIRSTEEKALGVLGSIEGNTAALLAINKAVDEGRIGTEGTKTGVIFNDADDPQAIGVVDLSLPPEEIAAILAEVEEENAKIAAKIASGAIDQDPRVMAFQANFDEFTKIIAKNAGLTEDIVKGQAAEVNIGRINYQIEEFDRVDREQEFKELAEDAGLRPDQVTKLRALFDENLSNFDPQLLSDIKSGKYSISDLIGVPSALEQFTASANRAGKTLEEFIELNPWMASLIDEPAKGPTIDIMGQPIGDIPKVEPAPAPNVTPSGGGATPNTFEVDGQQYNAGGQQVGNTRAANSTGFGTSLGATLGNPVVQNYLANTYNYFPSTVGSERLLASSSGR